MKVKIDRNTETDRYMMELIPGSSDERETIEQAMKEMGSAEQTASFYAEPGKVIYGITDGRDDGRVMVGSNGQPPKMSINLF